MILFFLFTAQSILIGETQKAKVGFIPIINFTEDIYNKIVKVHFIALLGQWNSVRQLFIPSVRGLFLYQYCFENLYTALTIKLRRTKYERSFNNWGWYDPFWQAS